MLKGQSQTDRSREVQRLGWLPVELQCPHMQKWWLPHGIVIHEKVACKGLSKC